MTDLPILNIAVDLLLAIPGEQFVELQVPVEEIHDFVVVVLLKEVFPLVLGGRVKSELSQILKYIIVVPLVTGFLGVLKKLLHSANINDRGCIIN
jgi:hypothetical protein